MHTNPIIGTPDMEMDQGRTRREKGEPKASPWTPLDSAPRAVRAVHGPSQCWAIGSKTIRDPWCTESLTHSDASCKKHRLRLGQGWEWPFGETMWTLSPEGLGSGGRQRLPPVPGS